MQEDASSSNIAETACGSSDINSKEEDEDDYNEEEDEDFSGSDEDVEFDRLVWITMYIHYQIFNKISTAGTVYPSRACKFTSGF